MAYGNEDYRDFHYSSWKNLSNEQQGYFGGDKNAYRQYKEDNGLDGFKSAKDKAQSYQFDKQWKQLGADYHGMHTKEQHQHARNVWQDNKALDYNQTSAEYQAMVDRNAHSQWYKPPTPKPEAPKPSAPKPSSSAPKPSTPSQQNNQFNDNRGNGQGQGPTAPGQFDPNTGKPIKQPGEKTSDYRVRVGNWKDSGKPTNSPAPQPTGGGKPVKQEGEKTSDYRNRVGEWKDAGKPPAANTAPIQDNRGNNQGNGPTQNNNYGGKPVKQEGEKTADYRDRVQEWKDSGGNSGGGGNNGGGGGNNGGWTYDDPTQFWEKHTGGVGWNDLRRRDKKQYGEWGQLGYMSGATGWGQYKDLNKKLQAEWDELGGASAYREARDYYNNYQTNNGGGGGTTGGGSTGGGGTTTVIVGGDSGGGYQGPTFEEQQQLAQEQRDYDREQRELDREQRTKDARLNAILAGMSNNKSNFGGGSQGGNMWMGSGFQRRERSGFQPW